MFGFAFKADLIAAPVRYGDQFDKPPKRVMRLERHRKGPEAHHRWRRLEATRPGRRPAPAMIRLGLNCGYSQKDCADLQRTRRWPAGLDGLTRLGRKRASQAVFPYGPRRWRP